MFSSSIAVCSWKVVDHLLAGPVLGMHSGIDYPAHGAPHFVLQAAVFAVGILIKADFFSQTLGVERPAFGVCIEVEVVLAERRQAGEFLRNRKLQVMAGNPFVVGDGFDVEQQPLLGRIFIDVDPPRPRAVSGANRIIGGRRDALRNDSIGTTSSLFFGSRPNSSGSFAYIWSR
jgi:hypothetical protein